MILLAVGLFIVWAIIGLKIFAPARVTQYKTLCRVSMSIGIVLISFVIFLSFAANVSESTNVDEYEMLELYQEAVETSNNEYLRFDYYERVNNWNEFFTNYQNFKSNIWLAPPFMPDLSENAGLIHFFLRQG
jgi:hypothetical protein